MTLFQRLVWEIRNRDDTATLARLALSTLDPNATGFEGLTEMQMMKTYFACRKLLGFTALTAVIDDLKVRQRHLIATQATKDNIEYGRGVLTGITLVAERLRVLSEKAGNKGEEEFDKFNPI